MHFFHHQQELSKADLASSRKRMVADQLAMPARDITNPDVLNAMQRVPRHEFLPRNLWQYAKKTVH